MPFLIIFFQVIKILIEESFVKNNNYSVKEFLAHCGPGKLGGIIVKVDRIRGTMYEICCQIWTVFSGDLPKKMTSLAPNTMWMADWVKCSVLLASVRVNVGTFGAYLFSVSYALMR